MTSRLKIVQGDITMQQVDAIVNAANTSLLGGGGVDGAIHRAAGPKLLQECRKLGGCKTGKAKITKGYRLKARYVIHTVGPVWHGDTRGEAKLLASCYRHSLELAIEHDCQTVAFPAISCGVYGYPLPAAAKISIQSALDFFAERPAEMAVCWVLFSHDVYQAWQRAGENLGVDLECTGGGKMER